MAIARFPHRKVESYRPPEWPGQDRPQQMHIDVIVDDLDAAEPAVTAGHPFCICLD